MRFVPTRSPDEIKEMFSSIGVKHFDELTAKIPEKYKIKGKLHLNEPLSELEMMNKLGEMSKKNEDTKKKVSFLGGGIYDHFIPSAIDAIVSRSEYYTSYTPYQAEIAQGTLQAMYEFQSMISELTGLEVSNSSLYDGATALSEAMLSSVSLKSKKKIIVSGKLNPNHLAVLHTYAERQGIEIEQTRLLNGRTDLSDLKEKLKKKDVSSVIVQQPNYYGIVEEAPSVSEIAKLSDALVIVSADPISLGILEAPGYYGADIVVGEGQSLGCYMNYGGPYLGFYSVRKDLIRSLPGRLSGMTIDSDGQEGFILTLQTREQHIRRDKATSNICTSQTLLALRAAIYMSLMGKEGIKEVAIQCTKKAHYLKRKLIGIQGVDLTYDAPFFKEFVITTSAPTDEILKKMVNRGFWGGISLDEGRKHDLLIAVTEKRTKSQIDNFISTFSDFE